MRYFKARFEPSKFLTVPVEGKSTLEEGLDAAMEADVFDDYKWEQLEDGSPDGAITSVAKRTSKRQMLQSLPPHMVLHLRRFAFDMQTFVMKKVNDFYAFPHVLDMHPYTAAGLAKRHRDAIKAQAQAAAEEAEGDKSSPKQSPSKGKQSSTGPSITPDPSVAALPEELTSQSEAPCRSVFLLSGVVIHRGTAQAGHYYSLIRDRRLPVALKAPTAPESKEKAAELLQAAESALRGEGAVSWAGLTDDHLQTRQNDALQAAMKEFELDEDAGWFEFNDRRVDPFPKSKIVTEAFGGSDGGNQNGFLLMYDRLPEDTVVDWLEGAVDVYHQAL